jgi:hypothetical protein
LHETVVYCNTLPQEVNPLCLVEKAAAEQPASHRYRITPGNDGLLLELVDQFRLEGITYAATIQDKNGLLSRWIGRPGRSPTCEAIWFALAVVGVGNLLWFLPYAKIGQLLREAIPF